MSPLQAAINAKATPNQRAAFAAEDWCKRNPGWVRICDIPSDQYEEAVYYSWEKLPATQKRPWIRNYKHDAQAAWENYGRTGTYKVPAGYIDETGNFLTLMEWRTGDLAGRGFMAIFNLGAN